MFAEQNNFIPNSYDFCTPTADYLVANDDDF